MDAASDPARAPARRRVAPLSLAAIAAAALVLTTWAIASPPGSSPDDVYHLASIWCADGSKPGTCELLADGYASTPLTVAQGNCHANDPQASGACITGDETGTVTHPPGRYQPPGWGQFYPPVFYRVMHTFVSSDVTASIVAMRLFNALLAISAASLVLALAPPARRGGLALGWLVAVVPIGLFIITATNPQSWGLIGAGTAWCLALIWREQPTRLRRAVAGIGCLAMLAIAFSARFDAGAFALLGVILGLLLSHSFTAWARSHLVPIGIALAAISALILVQVTRSGQGRLLRTTVTTFDVTDTDRLFANLVDVPQFVMGNLGSYGDLWGLGQLDTVLPAAVGVLGVIAYGGAVAIGLGRTWRTKSLAVLGLAAAIVLIPVMVFQAGLIDGATQVGVGIQPRYLLPVMLILAGVALVSRRRYAGVTLTGAQRWMLWVCVSIAQAVALHTLLRRYISGQDVRAFDLSVQREWWWQHAPDPQVAWIAASVAFAFVAAVVLARMRTPSELTR